MTIKIKVEAACNLVILFGMVKAESAAIMTEILAAAEPEDPALFVPVEPFDGAAGAARPGSLPGPKTFPPLACAENGL